MNQELINLTSKEIDLLEEFHEKAKSKIMWTSIGFVILWIISMVVPLKFLPKRRARNISEENLNSTVLESLGPITFIIATIIIATAIGIAIYYETRIKKIKLDLEQKKKTIIKSKITEMLCVENEWTALIEPVNDVKRIQLGDHDHSFKAGDEIEIEIFQHSHFPIKFLKTVSANF